MRGLSRHGIVDIYIKVQMLLFRDNETTNEESGLAPLDLVYSERLSRSSRVAPAGIVFALVRSSPSSAHSFVLHPDSKRKQPTS